MLTSDEVEAAVLGAQWATGHGDLLLARAARDLIAKTTATMPETLRPLILDASARTPPDWKTPPDGIDIARARGWVRFGRRSRSYRDNEDRKTDRIIWPIVVGYHAAVRMLIGWCERRQALRSFRIDRVVSADFREERYPAGPSALRAKRLATLPRNTPQE